MTPVQSPESVGLRSQSVSGGGQSAPLDKSNQRVRDMFGQIAPRYDLMNHLLSLNIDRWWRRSTVQRLRVAGNSPILDVCTGTGDLALAIKARVGHAVPVVGSDFCHPMLQRGVEKVAASDARTGPAVTFVEADSQHLPFQDNTFQCVTVAFGLRNISDTDRGLQEMRRVCKSEGQVAVLEFSQPTAIGLKQLYAFYFRHVLPRVGQWMARNNRSAYSYLPESVAQFPSGVKLAEQMESNGIQNVKMYPMTCGIATLYEGTK
jgi:demethylmenaquinone methyltransferase/2-methoxy-6-polyprenyl-1,4-benzoquinol methylase